MDIVQSSTPAPRPLPFDPVCGSPLPGLYQANPFCDGGYTYYFCSVMCRRFFIDQRDAERRNRADPALFGGAAASTVHFEPA